MNDSRSSINNEMEVSLILFAPQQETLKHYKNYSECFLTDGCGLILNLLLMLLMLPDIYISDQLQSLLCHLLK